jgi:hypothetical protein
MAEIFALAIILNWRCYEIRLPVGIWRGPISIAFFFLGAVKPVAHCYVWHPITSISRLIFTTSLLENHSGFTSTFSPPFSVSVFMRFSVV